MVGDDADDPSGGLKSLILDAFAVAKASEKEDWHRMYAGVLKNRLLRLTHDSFHESQWGAGGFTALLDTMPELVRVDRGIKPPTVELLDPAQVADHAPDPYLSEPVLSVERPVVSVAPPDSRRWRIRKDLWDAVMAVRDPEAFVWDMGAVVRMSQDEAAEYEQSRLPTLTSAELDGWYQAFADGQGASDSRYADLLKSWASNDIATTALPRALQHLWYAELKSHVRRRLEDWFKAREEPVPPDLIQAPSAASRIKAATSTSDLRAVVRACVDVMTEQELRELRLSPDAVLRAHLLPGRE